MADQIDIDNLVRQLEQLVPALNELSGTRGTRAQNNQNSGDELKKGFDKVVRSIAKLSASLDRKAKSEDDRTRSTEEFVKSIDDASDALDELTKAQQEQEKQAQAQLDAIQSEIAAREEAAKVARMSTAELAEKARKEKLSAAQSYADSQKQAQLNRKGTDSASAMLDELGRIPHGTAALRERFEGLGGSSMGATVGLKLTTAALEGLVSGLGAYGSALYKNEIGAKTAAKGMTTFVKAVAGAAKAIGAILLLVPGFQVLGAGLLAAGFAAEKFAEYTEAAAEMSDNLYNSFQDLQKTGVIGAGAMSEVAESARRLNLGLDAVGLQKFGKLMEKNSESLAALGGSAIRGRKAFVEIGEQLTHGPTGRALMNMGMSIENINEGTASYLALQAQTGQGQRKTTQQLQQGAMAYLKEMDGLAKLTGIQRQEMEANIQKARAVEQFRAKVNAMRASGDEKQIKAADEMERYYAVLAKKAPGLAQGFAEAASGLITSDAGRDFFMTIDRNSNVIRGLSEGAMNAAQAFDATTGAAKTSEEQFRNIALAGASPIKYAEASDLAALSANDYAKSLKDVQAEQERQAGGADKATSAQTDMRMAQMETRDSLQNMVNVGVAPATKAMSGFSDVVNKGTSFLAKALGIEKTMDPAEAKKRQAAADAQDEANLEQATTLEKVSVTAARGVEKVGYGMAWLAKKVGLEGLGGAIEDATTESQEARVQRDREYLERTGRQARQVSGGGAAGAAGGRAPGGPQGAAAPSFGGGAVGGGGVGPVAGQAMGTRDLQNAGLVLKQGDVQAEGSTVNPRLVELAKRIQSEVPGFSYFSGFNDRYHQERSPSSQHTRGLAADFTVGSPPSPEQGQRIVAQLKGMGFNGQVIDEYNNPSSRATAGHFHAAIQAQSGGIFSGPRTGYPATLHGREAVVPLPDGKKIPVNFEGGGAGGAGNVVPVTLSPNPFPDLQNTFTKGFTSFADQQKIVEGMLRPVKSDTQSLFDKVGEAFRKASELVSGDMKNMTGAMTNATYTVNGKEVSEQEYNKARADIDRQFGNMTTMFRGIGERATQDLGPNAAGPRGLFDSMKNLWSGLGQQTTQASQLAEANANYMVNGQRATKEEYEKARGAMQAQWQSISKDFGDLSGTVQSTAAPMTSMFDGIKNMWSGMDQQVNQAAQTSSTPLTSMFDRVKNMWSGLTKEANTSGTQLERMQGNMDAARQRHYARLADMSQKTDAQTQSANAPMTSMFDRVKNMWSGLTKEATDGGSQLERMQSRMDDARRRHYARLDNQEKSGQQSQIDSTDMVSRTRARIEEARQRMAKMEAEAEKQGNVEYEVNGRKVDKQQYDAFLKNNPELARMQERLRGNQAPDAAQTQPAKPPQDAAQPEKGLWERLKESIGGLFGGLTSKADVAAPSPQDQQKSQTSPADIVQKSQVDPTDMVSRTRARIEAARQRMAKMEAEAEKQGTATYKVNGRTVDKKQYDAELAAAQQNLTAAQKIDQLKGKARSTEEGARIGAMNDANMGLTAEQKLAKLREKSGQAQFSGLTRPTRDFQEVDITSQFDRINEQIKTQLPSGGIMGDDWMADTDTMTSDWLAMGEQQMARERDVFNTATAVDPAMRPGQNLDASIKKLEESLTKITAQTTGAGAPGAPGAPGASALTAEPTKLDGMNELLGKLSDMVSQQRTTTAAIEKMAQYQRA